MRTEISYGIRQFFSLVMLTLAIVVSLTLAGCGGGGSSGSGATPSTSGFSAGEITGFGSIIVNGVTFHTGGAELVFDDGSDSIILTNDNNELHLSRGMEVEVEGSFDDNGNGTASRVTIDSTLDGPIANLSQNGGIFTFTILGQTVIAVSGDTVVDDTVLNGSLSNLANGMVIEVHGLPDGNGTVQASFIEWKAADASTLPPGALELTGQVSALNTANFTFMIGSQLVDYSGALVRDGTLANGVLVEVKGDLNGATFEADDVEVKDGFGNNLAKTEIEGLVTDLNTSANTFRVRGQLVNYASAQFIGGVEGDLINGLKVEAEGPISSGVLLAVKVKFKDNFRYEGPANRLGNELTVANPGGPDLTITIDSSLTRDETTGGDGLGQFKLRARQLSGATLVATRAEDDDQLRDRQEFQAPVIRIAEPFVEILDLDGTGTNGVIVVDTSTINNDDFEIEDNEVSRIVTRLEFFNTLRVGDIVKARWDLNNNEWDQIEIELDD